MSLTSRVLAFVGRLSAAVALTAVFASASHAALVRTIDGAGKLTGATGVDVGGVFYDVSFVDGTCAAVFSGCDSPAVDFAFTTLSGATLASQALLDQVFIDVTSEGDFDSLPSMITGCSSAQFCATMTPWSVTDGGQSISMAYAGNTDSLINNDFVSGSTFNSASDTSRLPSFGWARWTPAAAVVPEPSSLALLGAAGVALAWSQRRRRSYGNDRAQ